MRASFIAVLVFAVWQASSTNASGDGPLPGLIAVLIDRSTNLAFYPAKGEAPKLLVGNARPEPSVKALTRNTIQSLKKATFAGEYPLSGFLTQMILLTDTGVDLRLELLMSDSLIAIIPCHRKGNNFSTSIAESIPIVVRCEPFVRMVFDYMRVNQPDEVIRLRRLYGGTGKTIEELLFPGTGAPAKSH